MSYVLYWAPGAASMAVHWMLIELGVPFEARQVDLSAPRDADYMRLNPAGQVPTLVVDGAPHGESAALLMLLAERHPAAGLAPAPGAPGRADWLEAMVHLANGGLPAMRNWFYAGQDGSPAGAEAVRALARTQVEALLGRLDTRLADGRTFLLGQALTTADFLALMLMRWTRNMPRPATGWPHLAAYIARLRARPAYLDLCRREGLTEWMNG